MLPFLTLAVTSLAATSASPGSLTNSLDMRMQLIPAGEFFMGNDEAAASLQLAYPLISQRRLEELKDEAPRHKVRITKAFPAMQRGELA